MGRLTNYVVQVFRFLGLLGAILAAGGAFGLAVALLEGLERQGYALPIGIPLSGPEAETLLLGGFSAIVIGASIRLVASSVAEFMAGFQSDTEQPATGEGPAVPAAERYCRRLETMYLVNGGFMAVVTAFAVLGTVTLGIVGRFAVILVTVLFGSVLGSVVVSVSLLGLWYGVAERATEALIGGFAFAVLFLILGLLGLRFGFLIFGALLGYYSTFARGATEFRYVKPAAVPAAIRERVR